MKSIFYRIIVFILFLALIEIGCEKEKSSSVCGIDDPLTKINWLKNLKNNLEEDDNVSNAEIILYTWNTSDYIYVQKIIGSAQDFPNVIFDCEGNEKYTCGGNQPINNCSDFFSKAQKIKTLWKK